MNHQDNNLSRQKNYDQMASMQDQILRQKQTNTIAISRFNNWIKAVLIDDTSTKIKQKLKQQLEIGQDQPSQYLCVFDVGCGRGQDINKWKKSQVFYVVASDFSSECLMKYQERWKKAGCPYNLYTVVESFLNQPILAKINHSYYDIVSAQFCFHYMFQDQNSIKKGLSLILSNLLVGGVFIATIPDQSIILNKLKTKGKKQKNNSLVYTNSFFSIKLYNHKNNNKNKQQTQSHNQNLEQNNQNIIEFGHEYGFYLKETVGTVNDQTGQINYINQWLIDLKQLQINLEEHGVLIQSVTNFEDYYNFHKSQYKDLLTQYELPYNIHQTMQKDLWQLAQLYNVLVCRKIKNGKYMKEYSVQNRKAAVKQNSIQKVS